jgi:hypothetical protein
VSASQTRHEAFFDIHPVSCVSIEVFYADRSLETFGWRGAGWFWWPRRRGFAPTGPAIGPFPTSYAAYRDALGARNNPTQFGRRIKTGAGACCAAQASQTLRHGAEEQIASEPARAAARAPDRPLQKRSRCQSLVPTIGGEGDKISIYRTHSHTFAAIQQIPVTEAQVVRWRPRASTPIRVQSVLKYGPEYGRDFDGGVRRTVWGLAGHCP